MKLAAIDIGTNSIRTIVADIHGNGTFQVIDQLKLYEIDRSEHIDGFPAQNGIINGGYSGMLSGPPDARPRPFEIVLETPRTPPTYLKEAAFVAALRTILP